MCMGMCMCAARRRVPGSHCVLARLAVPLVGHVVWIEHSANKVEPLAAAFALYHRRDAVPLQPAIAVAPIRVFFSVVSVVVAVVVCGVVVQLLVCAAVGRARCRVAARRDVGLFLLLRTFGDDFQASAHCITRARARCVGFVFFLCVFVFVFFWRKNRNSFFLLETFSFPLTLCRFISQQGDERRSYSERNRRCKRARRRRHDRRRHRRRRRRRTLQSSHVAPIHRQQQRRWQWRRRLRDVDERTFAGCCCHYTCVTTGQNTTKQN